MSAAAAQNCGHIEFFLRPNHWRMTGKFGVASITGKPIPAALELDRDEIALAVVVRATRFVINLRAYDGHVVD